MKKILPGFLLLLTFVVFGASADGQAPITEEKRKLIGELITELKMDSQMSEIMDSVLNEMETTYPITFAASVDSNPALTAKEKESLKASSTERFLKFSEKFRKALSASVDYPKFVQDAVYPLYDQIFSEQELKDLIVFYRTPTGQSMITKFPRLVAASQTAAREKLLPQIIPIVQKLVEEEFGQAGAPRTVKTDVYQAPPAPKKTN